MINILLNGCNGNMGKAVINYVDSLPDFKILYGIDKDNADLFNNIYKKPDVIIDFSTTEATFTALNYAVENLVPIVIATTGFSQIENRKICEYAEAIPIFKSSNMSYCIHLFSRLAGDIAQKLKNMDIEIIEKHHRYKKDSPSGTALMIANSINEKCNNKYKFIFNRTSKTYNSYSSSDIVSASNADNVIPKQPCATRAENEIGFSSIRGGGLVGEHTVLFLGENESIEITHTAYSRNIYVEGVLDAARFIILKKNGLYGMEDLI